MLKRNGFAGILAFTFLTMGTTSQCPAQAYDYLDQGWTQDERQWWYTASQGSRLLPQAWFMALELAGSAEKFASPANMKRYHYLANDGGSSLPIGFAVDTGAAPDGSGEPWIGMTCSACHTGEIAYNDKRMRIDGAPTLADYQNFIEDFAKALQETAAKPDKFDRFAAEVLAANAGPKRGQLKADLQKQVDWYSAIVAKSQSPVRYGHGRLDAQGHILNKASLILGVAEQLGGYPADAPASYPFLWTTPQQERVQWNGLVDPNFPPARNVGQLVGVFGSIDVASNPTAYPSSLRSDNMNNLETLVTKLKAPLWPDSILPKIGPVEAGRALFKQNCESCHTSVDRTTGQKVPADQDLAQMQTFAELGTDIWLSCNAFMHSSKTGVLEGRLVSIFNQTPLQHIDKTSLALTNIIFGVLTPPSNNAPANAPSNAAVGTNNRPKLLTDMNRIPGDTPVPPSKAEREAECRTTTDKTLAYKGGPLNGIWATAPYLHNGSVPTLADLLLPASQRPAVFTVGGIVFDPDHVGFKSGPGDGPFEFHVRDGSGAVIPGNDNAGHEYGTQLSAADRAALLEYLKSL